MVELKAEGYGETVGKPMDPESVKFGDLIFAFCAGFAVFGLYSFPLPVGMKQVAIGV